MKSPVCCVLKDLFICNADVVIRMNRVHFRLTLNIEKAIVHRTPAADRSRREDKLAQKYLSRKGKSSHNYGFQ